jgi:C-terminal processing protease CtpA/Prc
MDQASSLSAGDRAELIERVAGQLQEGYLFPQKGLALARKLRQKLAQGQYEAMSDPHALGPAVTADLFAASQDPHLRLWYDPDQAAAAANSQEAHETLLRRHFERARRANFGFIRVERLAGNIGYLDVRGLPPPAVAGEVAAGAMAFLAHTQALILDLRYNGGGTPEMVQLLASYLFDSQPRPLSGIQSGGEDAPEPFYTLPEISGRAMPDVPLFILISGMTHSAAEALAYDLQALERATVVGQRSRGGAHLVDYQVFAGAFLFTLPVARAVNPLTGTNWEGRGVIPDIESPVEQALVVAQKAALNKLLEEADSGADRRFLQWEMESLEAQLTPAVVPEERLARCSGSYGEWRIIFEDGRLHGHQYIRRPLIPMSQRLFMLSEDVRLRFTLDSMGQATALHVLDREGQEQIFSRQQEGGDRS